MFIPLGVSLHVHILEEIIVFYFYLSLFSLTTVLFPHYRTGSKLGISPLMLAAMNGHVPAVKLLLDMGSDINAQIETNRNTALTLACFQGRAEVVSLLLDRKANVEHRAKVSKQMEHLYSSTRKRWYRSSHI